MKVLTPVRSVSSAWPGRFRSTMLLGLPLLAAAALSACVVVPIDPKTGQPYGHAPQPAPVVVVQQQPSTTTTAATPQVTVLTARMYPVNDIARTAGLTNATVIDNGTGRGSFSFNYLGQTLQGESTRVDRNFPSFGAILQQVQGGYQWSQAPGQRGIANAAGNGVSMRCEYLFTAPGQGTGACIMSDGARFQLHFGS